jgi:hypothetical protein
MPARFLVLLTDAHQDGTAALATPQCGSVLYCGKTDSSWPDKQEMGFPFHRPLAEADDPVSRTSIPCPTRPGAISPSGTKTTPRPVNASAWRQ